MKLINLYLLIVLASIVIFTIVKILIIPIENKSLSKQLKIDPWYEIDTLHLSGVKIDSCRCVLIDGKIYKVNPTVRTSFTYTPINK